MKKEKVENKSLKLNTVLYAFKTFMGLVFPLITFPYASRILGAGGIGNVTFSNSIVSYFILVAGLGVMSYAIREGAKYRNEEKAFESFANEVYTINIIATVVSMVAFLVTIFFFDKLAPYRNVLLILGLSIPLTTVGVEWIFNIFEDYLYITVRSLVIQIVSIGVLLVCVRTKEDVYGYAFFYLFSTVASNVFNLFYARKYCKLRLCFSKKILVHFKPVMVIFASTVASTIYVSTDTTLLGIMHDDTTVGYYAASTKIYNMLRMSMDAIISVSFARLAFYLGNKQQEEYERLLRKLLNLTFMILCPLSVGVFCLSKEAILILNGAEYAPAVGSLQILCIALPFSVLGGFVTRTIFLPYKHEFDIFVATVIGAVVNFVLNLYMIPKWMQDGAALTTVIAEMTVLGIHIFNMNRFYKLRGFVKCLCQTVVSSIPIVFVCHIVKQELEHDILKAVVAVIISGSIYVLLLIIQKNELMMEYGKKMFSMLNKRKKRG